MTGSQIPPYKHKLESHLLFIDPVRLVAAVVFDLSFSLFVDIAPFTPSSDAVWVFEAIICWIYVIRNLTIINYLSLSNLHIFWCMKRFDKTKITFCGTSGSTSALRGILKNRIEFSSVPRVICRTLKIFRNDCSTTGSFLKSFPGNFVSIEDRIRLLCVLPYWVSWFLLSSRFIGGRQKRHTFGGFKYGSSIWK